MISSIPEISLKEKVRAKKGRSKSYQQQQLRRKNSREPGKNLQKVLRKVHFCSVFLLSDISYTTTVHLKVLHYYFVFITWKKMLILLIFNFHSHYNITFNFRIMKLKPLQKVIKRYVYLRFIKGNKNEIFLKNVNMPCPRFYSPMSFLLYSARRNQHMICRVAYFNWKTTFPDIFTLTSWDFQGIFYVCYRSGCFLESYWYHIVICKDFIS